MLYKEWEYRHRVLWISFNLWGLVVVTLMALPFVKPELFDLGWAVLVLPAFGLGACLFASVHILAEAKRMDLVGSEMGKYRTVAKWPHDTKSGRLKHRVQSLKLGKIIGNLFLYVLGPACVSSAIIQSTILCRRFGNPIEISSAGLIRAIPYVIALFLPIGGAFVGINRALNAELRKQREKDEASQLPPDQD